MLRRWSGVAGRLVVDGLIAVGCFAAGVCPPERPAADRDDAAERAIWAQLPELHQLLPLLDRPR